MLPLLLKLFGVKIDAASNVSGVQLALRNSGMLSWIIFLGLILSGLAWWCYWRDARTIVTDRRRRLLVTLRVVLFALLLLLLLRPVLAFTVDGSIRRGLVTLVDVSASMKIQDPRFDDADLKRAAIAKGDLDLRRGLDQSLDASKTASLKLVSRVDLLRAMLKNTELNLYPRLAGDFDLSTFTFGQNLSELSGGSTSQENPASNASPDWLDKLSPTAPATALGDALRELLSRKRGQPLAGIFLVTDGASNTGIEALEGARLARQEGVPLYIYGVGITSPRDIIVGNLFTQEVAFVKDELPVTVRVRGQGLKGQTAEIKLKLGDDVVARKQLEFQSDDEMTVSLPFTPKETGEFQLTASIDPREDEASKDNNSTSQRLKVIDSKIKVLYYESTPRWEFRYLQAVLLRDRRLDFKNILLEGDPGITEGESSPYLPRFPQTKEELFKYDLVILGDVGQKDFVGDQLQWVSEFVSKFGGSLLLIAGPRNGPETFRGSPVEKLLPVELGEKVTTNGPERPTALELTPAGRTSALLKLSPKEDENASIWQHFPRIYFTARVGRAKPAAQVLLQDSDPGKATRFGKMPVIALQQFGLGQVLYIGTDDTWRWRRNANDRYYPMLWGQIAQKMGLQHILGGSKRTQLTVDKQSYTTGERVAVYARLYNPDYTPVHEVTVPASFTIQGATPQDVILRAVPEQPGMYRGDFVPVAAGLYQFSVKNDPQTVIEFSVAEPQFELGETAMNEALLKQMAEVSGGAFFREENIYKLPETVKGKTERIESTVDAEVWSSPFYFLLILVVASVEWGLRKKAQLK